MTNAILDPTWMENVLSRWNSCPICEVIPLYDIGLPVLERIQVTVENLPGVPQTDACVTMLPEARFHTAPPSLGHVLNDFAQRNEHNIFDFISLTPADGAVMYSDVVVNGFNMLGGLGWNLGRKVYGALNIPATRLGLGSCGLRAAPYDSVGGAIVDDGPWFSVLTLPSSITHPHIDYHGASQYVVHIFGEKLWLFWPPSEKNLDYFSKMHGREFTPDRLSRCIDNLEGLQVLHLKDAHHTFAMGPNVIHACLSLTVSSHTTKKFWRLRRFDDTVESLAWATSWVLDNLYSDIPVTELLATTRRIRDDWSKMKSLVLQTPTALKCEDRIEHLENIEIGITRCFSALKLRFECKRLHFAEDSSDDDGESMDEDF